MKILNFECWTGLTHLGGEINIKEKSNQDRDTGNIWYTRPSRQGHWQHLVHNAIKKGTLAPFGTQGNQDRDTGNIWYTRQSRQGHWQHLVHNAIKTGTLAPFGTQGNQDRDTDNIWYTKQSGQGH